jgi:hypothetical protein
MSKRRKRTIEEAVAAGYTMGVAEAFLARLQAHDPKQAIAIVITQKDRKMLEHAIKGLRNACAFGEQPLGFVLWPDVSVHEDTTTDR